MLVFFLSNFVDFCRKTNPFLIATENADNGFSLSAFDLAVNINILPRKNQPLEHKFP